MSPSGRSTHSDETAPRPTEATVTPGAAEGAKGGFVAWFAGHHVAANLLMVFLLAVGALSMVSTTLEIFPEFSIDTVTIRVPYLGATPAETEEGVTVKVEEAIASIDGIKRIRSTASEGSGSVVAEIDTGADNQKVLDDIKAAVDRIDTFPAETEEPVISEVVTRRQVVSVAIYGDVPNETLAALAERIRDDLTSSDAITQAEVKGVPPYEISIEVSEESLRRYGLSFAQVSDAVRRSSLDLPGGGIKTAGGEILLRTTGQRYVGREFEDIVVLTRGDGTRVLLSDVATVIDGFEDSDIVSRFDGQPAALVQVYRTGDEGALDVSSAVREYLDEAESLLPAGVEVATWQDASVTLRQRIGLLLKNARLGLILVFVCLAFFLDLRLAFWTTMGIAISFLGGFALLPTFDVTINMVSLFAFIVSLGIVVDDAIIVGENIFSKMETGMEPLRAAVEGAKEMMAPVTFAVLTSIAAFLPMVFVEGSLGKVMRQIPLVVIAVLLMSLIESLLILPAHLGSRHAPRPLRPLLRLFRPVFRAIESVQARVAGGLQAFVDGPYRRFLDRALDWRYLTASLAVVILFLAVGLALGGFVKFSLMPNVEADSMVAYLKMPQGTPVEQTEIIAQRMEREAQETAAEVEREQGLEEGSLIVHVNTTVGEQPSSGGGGPTSTGSTTGGGSHLAEVNVELQSAETREVGASLLLKRWRDRVGEVPGATALTYSASLFTAGDAISVQLAHRDDETLLRASDRLQEILAEFGGTTEIADSFVAGKKELRLDLSDEGRALGLTLQDLARQVRQGFYGEEAQRIQRGRDDIRVMIRYPEAERRSRGDIEEMRIRTPEGAEVPFTTVARVEEGRGFAQIDRVDRRRVVTVTADVDSQSGANANEINQSLREEVLPRLEADFPGLSFDFEGEQREQTESLGSLGRNFAIALLAIFALLAIPFRSYSQPLIVMSVIPFGFVGAVLGHLVMGLNLSLLSMFGIVALTGVVVNDSLIMIDLINRERRDGVPLEQAIRDSGTRRFRPILLTTLTTFFGLSPMILETSLQAQFLIPMAVSLGFGIVFATAITLILVPVVYRILEDFHLVTGSETIEDTTDDAPSDDEARDADNRSTEAVPSPAG